MKKLSIFLLMTALFLCILALSVGAEALEWSDITVVEGMSDKATFGADGTIGATSRVLMADGKTYPAYYIFKDSDTLSISFDEISKKSGTTYAKADVVRLEIPNGIKTLARLQSYTAIVEVVVPEGVESIVTNFLYELSTLTTVSLPSTVKTISSAAFYKIGAVERFVIPTGCTSIGEKAFKYAQIKSVVIPTTVETIDTETFYECKSLTTVACGASVIGSMAFKNCTALTSLTLENTKEIYNQAFYGVGAVEHVDIPSGCEKIQLQAFKKSGVLAVTIPSTITVIEKEIFEASTSLKAVYHYSTITGPRMYYGCSAIETLVIDKLVNAETYSFYGLKGLKTIELPETLETVGDYAFAGLGLEEIVLPASLSQIGASAFYNNSNLKRAVVLGSYYGKAMFSGCANFTELVLTNRFAECAATNTLNGASQKSFTTFYGGNDPDVLKSIMSGEMRITGAGVCTYEDYLAGNYTAKNYMIVYSTDVCEVAFGEHLEDGNPCVVNCDRCAVYGVAEKSPVHSEDIKYTYVSFDKAGERAVVCTNPGCQYKVAEAAEALFVQLGYSTSEFSNSGIIIGFYVNSNAVAKYTEAMGRTIEYGVFAANAASLGDNEAVDGNGVFYDGVLGTKLSNRGTRAFELKITGFTTDEQKNTGIVFGAYVIDAGEDGKSVSYMQTNEPENGGKYFVTTYEQYTK